jgi:hypothetical protein
MMVQALRQPADYTIKKAHAVRDWWGTVIPLGVHDDFAWAFPYLRIHRATRDTDRPVS